MNTRRKFLLQSAALATGGLLLKNNAMASFFQKEATRPMGLQLFTFFNEIDNDVPGTIKKIAAVGYKEIESAFSRKGGYYGMKSKEWASFLRDNGLSWKSHHVLGAPFKRPPGAKVPTGPDGKPNTIPPMKNLHDNMQELVDDAAEGGVKYLVCANTPINTIDDIQSSIETLNKTDEACAKAGIGFAYHNHDAEFRPVDGKIPYELFLSQTKMKMELDLAWCTKGGTDPVELFKKHPGRFPLWHVKDLDKTLTEVLPVGEGIIDYGRIFANADKAGMKHFFIEHDMPKDAMASITTSFANLTKLFGKS